MYQSHYGTGLIEGKEEGKKEGIKEEIEVGKKEGIEVGEKNKALEIAKQMLRDKLPIETVIKYSGLTEEEIKGIT